MLYSAANDFFYSRRIGRTYLGPPIEAVGLDQTK